MSRVDEVGEREGWRCWLCDEVVDARMSVNDPRGPSVDAMFTKGQAKSNRTKSKEPPAERLAHRGCNTRKGAVAPVVRWAADLFVADPAPILDTVEMLQRKGGRAVMARCPTAADADSAASWLADRLERLTPAATWRTGVEAGGGQFLVVLHA